MLKTLLILRLRALLSVLTGAGRTRRKQSRLRLAAFAALMLFSFGSIGYLFWHVFDVLAAPFSRLTLGWLYFTLAALLAFALMFVGGVFTAKSQLFEARDNELLLSLPIRPLHILLSRLFLLWLTAVLLGLPVAVPCLLVWPKALKAGGALAFALLYLVLLPCLCVSVSALVGWIVHRISARFGHKPAVTVLLWMLFLGGYVALSFRMNELLDRLASNPLKLARALRAPGPLAWMGRAVASADLAALGKLALPILALFFVVVFLLAKTFIRTATDRRELAKKRYVERSARIRSPRSTLLVRELRRLWSCPPYLFNSGLGVVMALVGSAALLVKARAVRALLQGDLASLAGLLQLAAIAIVCLLAATIFLTGPSISLEGKTLWVLRSLPVDTREILRAKLRLQLLVAGPPLLLLSVIAAAVLRTRGILLLFQLLLPLLYCLLIGLVGLAMNLRYPNFDWVNETQAVKSGASVLLTMLIGMGAAAVPVLVYIVSKARVQPVWLGAATALLAAAACLLLYRWLMRRGAEILERL